jgi:hypothetical protein
LRTFDEISIKVVWGKLKRRIAILDAFAVKFELLMASSTISNTQKKKKHKRTKNKAPKKNYKKKKKKKKLDEWSSHGSISTQAAKTREECGGGDARRGEGGWLTYVKWTEDDGSSSINTVLKRMASLQLPSEKL